MMSAAADTTPDEAPKPLSDEEILHDKIVGRLRTVYDPEIPVNLYDLGLIYAVEIDPATGDNVGKFDVRVKMTLTSVGCPLADQMPGMVSHALDDIETIASLAVDLVWDPPWNKDMMSEDARFELGWF
jgi:FeS assembly SUF system protein